MTLKSINCEILKHDYQFSAHTCKKNLQNTPNKMLALFRFDSDLLCSLCNSWHPQCQNGYLAGMKCSQRRPLRCWMYPWDTCRTLFGQFHSENVRVDTRDNRFGWTRYWNALCRRAYTVNTDRRLDSNHTDRSLLLQKCKFVFARKVALSVWINLKKTYYWFNLF